MAIECYEDGCALHEKTEPFCNEEVCIQVKDCSRCDWKAINTSPHSWCWMFHSELANCEKYTPAKHLLKRG